MSQEAVLTLRLEGPLQSWGYRSRFKVRDTGLEPSKSGVIGLLCCALGRDRSESPSDLAKLKMHVRVDRPGRLLSDFHTAGGGNFRGQDGYYAPTSSGAKGKNPVIMEKHYLTDASFVVALEGDLDLLQELGLRIQDPVWPLNLGRKSCPPSQHVYIGLSPGSASEVLPAVPASDRRANQPRYIWEADQPDDHTDSRNDLPVAWTDRLNREYAVRFVRTELGEWPE
jgi:CRISPR system Cascade subunit CasD